MKSRYIIFIVAMLLVSLTLFACAGIDLGDFVRVRTPNEIQQTTGLAETTTLNESEVEYRAWFEDVQRVGSQWRSNIDRGREVRGLFSQLALNSLDGLGPMIGGVPALVPAIPALTGLAGLFLGTGRLRREKEASFNKGLEKGSNPA